MRPVAYATYDLCDIVTYVTYAIFMTYATCDL